LERHELQNYSPRCRKGKRKINFEHLRFVSRYLFVPAVMPRSTLNRVPHPAVPTSPGSPGSTWLPLYPDSPDSLRRPRSQQSPPLATPRSGAGALAGPRLRQHRRPTATRSNLESEVSLRYSYLATLN
ncbi:hypothetical protein BRADI_2g47063v3, partial [Brachypodium distachyon]